MRARIRHASALGVADAKGYLTTVAGISNDDMWKTIDALRAASVEFGATNKARWSSRAKIPSVLAKGAKLREDC